MGIETPVCAQTRERPQGPGSSPALSETFAETYYAPFRVHHFYFLVTLRIGLYALVLTEHIGFLILSIGSFCNTHP